ncbi:bifunctional riboflavin kinase/FAD synthetase [Paenibacillus sabuli]|nr:bifunctional riboflavin kinase/FAD synthetase [Paenibacillus sabuli]
MITLHYPLSESERSEVGQTLAIGHFDGVHKGHRTVISRAVRYAREHDLLGSVMTFDPHPKAVLGQGDQYVACLTPLADKLEQFAELGVDRAYVFRFDRSFAQVSPEQFVDDALRPLAIRKAFVGFDFAFGHRGRGTPELLRQLGEPFMEVEVAEAYHLNGQKVSSTLVRENIASGAMEQATLLLGRPYRLRGIVAHGAGRGRTIGFPTANVELGGPYALPRHGVYAVVAHYEGLRLHGVMNVGVKPTFEDGTVKPTLEAHLFDFSGDLYGRELQLDVMQFLRPERKFDSVDALVAQIRADAEQARELLAAAETRRG